jgi:hypothetical protein
VGRAVGVRAIIEVDGHELKSEPIEVVLDEETPEQSASSVRSGTSATGKEIWRDTLSANLSGTERKSVNTVNVARQGLDACPVPGSVVAEMGTLNGAICYLSTTTAVGTMSAEAGITRTIIFTREGLYGMSSKGANAYIPPDLLHVSIMQGVGCVFGDGSGTISSEYVENLSSIGVSYSLFFYALGYTVFTYPGQGLVRAIQYDSGFSVSDSMAIFPSSLDMSVQTTSVTLQHPTFLRAWNNGCGADVDTDNPMKYFRDGVESLVDTAQDDTFEGNAVAAISAELLPLLDHLGTSGAGGLSNNVPAASNGDLYQQFLSEPGTALMPDSINTSIDGTLVDFRDRVQTAGDDTSAIVAAASENQGCVERSLPSGLGQAALQRDASAGVDLAGLLTLQYDTSTVAPKRFVSPDVVTISANSGEKVALTITAKEIGELIGRDAADVIGATVIVNAGADIQDVAYTLNDESLELELELRADSLLVRFDVDLSTAAGEFPDDAADWIVRPAIRMIKVKAGAPSLVLLNAPVRLVSGAPVSLNVQVVDAEGHLVKSDYKVRFIDDSGEQLGTATPKHGTTLFQYVPVPSKPVIELIEETELNLGKATVNGIRIQGTGFSKNIEVTLGDSATPIASDMLSVQSPEEILVVLPGDVVNGASNVTVRNPGGKTASGTVQLTNQ